MTYVQHLSDFETSDMTASLGPRQSKTPQALEGSSPAIFCMLAYTFSSSSLPPSSDPLGHGVDKSEQTNATYAVDRRFRAKLYLRIFEDHLDAMIVNSYIMYMKIPRTVACRHISSSIPPIIGSMPDRRDFELPPEKFEAKGIQRPGGDKSRSYLGRNTKTVQCVHKS